MKGPLMIACFLAGCLVSVLLIALGFALLPAASFGLIVSTVCCMTGRKELTVLSRDDTE